MSTEARVTELVSRLRNSDEIYESSMWDAIELAREAADALEEAYAHLEWEYATVLSGFHQPVRRTVNIEQAKSDVSRLEGDKVVRRVKAGPWVEVPND